MQVTGRTGDKREKAWDPLTPPQGPALQVAAGRVALSSRAERHRDGSADAGHVISQTRKQPHVSPKGPERPRLLLLPPPCGPA